MNEIRDLLKFQKPEAWEEKFYIKFWTEEEDDLLISKVTHDAILPVMANKDNRFVQIGLRTIAISDIRRIVPRYEPDNIPPRPGIIVDHEKISDNTMREIVTNQKILDLWDNLYGSVQNASPEGGQHGA